MNYEPDRAYPLSHYTPPVEVPAGFEVLYFSEYGIDSHFIIRKVVTFVEPQPARDCAYWAKQGWQEGRDWPMAEDGYVLLVIGFQIISQTKREYVNDCNTWANDFYDNYVFARQLPDTYDRWRIVPESFFNQPVL